MCGKKSQENNPRAGEVSLLNILTLVGTSQEAPASKVVGTSQRRKGNENTKNNLAKQKRF